MPTSLLLEIAVFITVAILVIIRRQNNKRAVSSQMEQIRTSDWLGWIEIANADYTPLFQGRILAAAHEHRGALLFGVLLEENAPRSLISAIKARPFASLTDGRILVRGLTSHDKKLITTRLDDQDLIQHLQAAMDKDIKPDTCLVIKSIEIQHLDTTAAMVQFERIWHDSLPPFLPPPDRTNPTQIRAPKM
jgi:hypothetical protein